MGDVTKMPPKSGPGVGHRPRKNADATTTVTVEDFESDDEVRNLEALKKRLSEMLADPSTLQRDFKALSVEYRAVMIELREARLRATAAQLGADGRRAKLVAVGERPFDGDI